MGIFSQQQQQQQQSALQQANRAQLMLNAVKAPRIFSDERDTAIMKFNLLQAYSGTGRGLASHLGEAQAVNFTPENPFCRFKVHTGCHGLRKLIYYFSPRRFVTATSRPVVMRMD